MRSLGGNSSLVAPLALSFIIVISFLLTLDGSVSFASAMPARSRDSQQGQGEGQARRCKIDGAETGRSSSNDDNALTNAETGLSDDPSGRMPPTDSGAASCDAGLDGPEDDGGLNFILWLKDTFDRWL